MIGHFCVHARLPEVSAPTDNHVVFYVLDGDVIRIVRVLRARMDPHISL